MAVHSYQPQLIADLMAEMKLIGRVWYIPRPIPSRLISQITSRLDKLERLFTASSDARDLVEPLGLLHAGFAFAAPTTDRQADERTKAYELALLNIPTWAVKAAVHRYLSGGYGEVTFCPTPPQLAIAARAQLENLVAESNALRRLLNARVEDEPRERVSAERVQALLSTFGVKMEQAS